MGTRGLIGFIIAGKRRGCYVQFDSYPEGLGADIARFLISLTPETLATMIKRLEEVRDEDPVPTELEELYKSLDFHLSRYQKEPQDDDPEYWDKNGSLYPSTHQWYGLLRGVQGAACLAPILDGSLKHLIDSAGFEQDGLFCEYSYWIDFENQTFQMGNSSRKRWNFDQLDTGVWGKLVDDKIRIETAYLEDRKKSEPQRKALIAQGNAFRSAQRAREIENSSSPTTNPESASSLADNLDNVDISSGKAKVQKSLPNSTTSPEDPDSDNETVVGGSSQEEH